MIEGLVEFGIDHFRQIDIIVLNAGGVREPAPIIAMTDEEWQYELDLNLNHTFWGMRAAFRHMVPRGWGRVIAMSSIEGKEGKANVAGYTANRHAINGLVKAAAREVGQHGITVNAICPGLVVTDMLIERAGRSMGVGSVDEVVALYTANTACVARSQSKRSPRSPCTWPAMPALASPAGRSRSTPARRSTDQSSLLRARRARPIPPDPFSAHLGSKRAVPQVRERLVRHRPQRLDMRMRHWSVWAITISSMSERSL